jgi:cyclopropane fatty-acyl-phospholipid synthase-like methyltransferase
MIEGVGHEYMDDFFGCCETLLAQDGIFVLQVSIFCTHNELSICIVADSTA